METRNYASCDFALGMRERWNRVLASRNNAAACGTLHGPWQEFFLL